MIVPEPIAAAITLGVLWARINGLPTFDDFGLVSAISAFRGAFATWKAWLAEELEKDEKLAALRRIEKQERDLRVLEAFPLRDTAEAQERLEALLAHLNDPRNRDHYRFAVWNERSGATDSTLMMLALAGLIEPNPVGMVEDLLGVRPRLRQVQNLSSSSTTVWVTSSRIRRAIRTITSCRRRPCTPSLSSVPAVLARKRSIPIPSWIWIANRSRTTYAASSAEA